jgi:hypothetical protein
MPTVRHKGSFFVIRPTDHTWFSHFITTKCDKHYCSSHYLQFKWDLVRVLISILKYEGRSQLREENEMTNGESSWSKIIAESTSLKLNTWVSGNTHIQFYLLLSHIHFSPLYRVCHWSNTTWINYLKCILIRPDLYSIPSRECSIYVNWMTCMQTGLCRT